LFAAFCLAGSGPGPRIGLTTPRAVGKSVLRNRLKRRVREVVRVRLEDLTAPWDIVINPRRPLANCPFQDLEQEIEKLFRRCNQSVSPASAATKS
jgi:ribonuclease P protein component